ARDRDGGDPASGSRRWTCRPAPVLRPSGEAHRRSRAIQRRSTDRRRYLRFGPARRRLEADLPTARPLMRPQVTGLTRATLETAPAVCRGCVWWQSRGTRGVDKERWIDRAEEEWGPWGTVYYDDDGRLLGSMQYGPSELFPRAEGLPAGPPTDDAVLVTCA